MSFILDALKKSEAERRQGEVPSLRNDLGPIVSRRRSVWPLLLTVALLLNVAVIGGWLLLRHERSFLAETPSGELERVLVAPSVPSPPVKPEPEPSPKKTSPMVEPEPTPSNMAVNPSPEPAAKPAPAALPRVKSSSPDPVVESPAISQPPVSLAMETPAVVSEVAEEAAADPPAESAQQFVAERATVAAAPVESFPRFADLSSDVRAGLPELNLQLHFYSPEPARRLVRLNGFNMREGDRGGGGFEVVEITPDGIRLSCRGVRFFLPPARR